MRRKDVLLMFFVGWLFFLAIKATVELNTTVACQVCVTRGEGKVQGAMTRAEVPRAGAAREGTSGAGENKPRAVDAIVPRR